MDLLILHNNERANRGLPPLAINPLLSQAAHKHAEWMDDHNRLSHTGFPRRLIDAGYVYSNCGENIAWNYTDEESCMQAWMGSSGHRRNVLGRFTEIGFAHVGSYWCACYGRPAATVEDVAYGMDISAISLNPEE